MIPKSGSPFTGPNTYGVTALPSGKALLTGSIMGPRVHADLYDPGTNAFVAAADMGVARELAGQALLPNGKVLVAGGYDGTSALASGEVYDPGTNTWAPVANSMNSGHVSPATMPLPGGKVLVFGGLAGLSGSVTPSPAAEIYDPATNTFTQTGNMVTTRLLPSVAALTDGRVLAAGGISGLSGPTPTFFSSAEIYQPTTGTWSLVSPMLVPETGGIAASLPNDEVLLAGGITPALSTAPTAAAQIYAPATVPTGPRSVTATAGNGTAAVSWSAPQVEGGGPITSYTVTASTGAHVTVSAVQTSASLTGLRNGTRVTFTVAATNSFGTGPASSPASAVIPGPPVIKFAKLAGKLKLKSFLKGVTATITPNKPSSLEIALLAAAKTATISRAVNLTLASKTFGLGGSRKVKLKPNRKLIGRAHKFSVVLRVIATDASGNRRTVAKTIKITG